MKYDAEQKRVIARIKAIGAKRGASAIEIKAALETGRVESNFRNLKGGDRDSAGWRQERAQYYKDPTNLDASINRFYDETAAVKDKYKRAGDLAAAVQRPAAQYRGRYEANSAEAERLMRTSIGGAAIRSGGGGGAGTGTSAFVTTGPPVTPDGATRESLLQQYVLNKGKPNALLGLATGISLLEAPTMAVSAVTGSKPRVKGGASSVDNNLSGQLLELFWQGPNGINAKNGKRQPQGFVSGHNSHVHAAAPGRDIVKLAKLAQSMGLHVGENPAYGGVAPVHVTNSNHYAAERVNGKKVGKAIDVSGDKKKLAAFAHKVAQMYGVK